MEKNMKKYVAWTYGVFWCCILVIGAVMLIAKSQTLTDILSIIASWTPWVVFAFMFKKIYPKDQFLSYVKRQFREKIHISVVLCIVLIFCLALTASLYFTSIFNGKSMLSQLITSPGALITTFFYQLVWGPIGEELEWRGYVLNELQKKYSPLKSTMIVATVWTFWHLPLWLVSGYSGINLVQYIVFFIVLCCSISIIMTAFYNINHNLVIPILIHQFVNYTLAIQKSDTLQMATIYAVFYLAVAVVLILVNYKKCLYGSKNKPEIRNTVV